MKEIWKQRRSAGTKGMKLFEDNARVHIHRDVINCLREEDIYIMAHPVYSLDRCTVIIDLMITPRVI